MGPNVLQVAQIFEDPEPEQRGRTTYRHYHHPDALTSSATSDALNGRWKENHSPTKIPYQSQSPTKAPFQNQSPTKTPYQIPGDVYYSPASPLGERHINSPPQSKRVATKFGDENGQQPNNSSPRRSHKKTGSSVSLKGLIRGKERANFDSSSVSSTEGRGRAIEKENKKKPKKVRSAANLTGLLKRKSKKDLKEDKEDYVEGNPSPNKHTPAENNLNPTPIWEQFATQPLESPDGTMLYPMAQRRTVEEEIKLYTPKDYSEFRPAEQRNFYGCGPALPSPSDRFELPPQRPFLEHKSSRSSIFTENLDDENMPDPKQTRSSSKEGKNSRPGTSGASEVRPPLATRSSETSQSDIKSKRGSRVFEAIQNLNMRSRRNARSVPESPSTPALSPQEIESAFEQVLDSLNIPLNMRDNMRNLKPDVKAGLIKGDRVGGGSSSNSAGADSSEVKPSEGSPRKLEHDRPKSQDENGKESKQSRSRSRPRSRILTLSRRDEDSSGKAGDQPGSSRSRSKSRNKSADLTNSRPASARAMASTVSLASLNGTDSATTPGDFIHYLREVQKPSLVEVSKLHKLRILVRNESVSWTDHFVTKGGMDELLQLYYRIKKIEWREEHEDNLLHETLLCLKGLCTTSLALERLQQVEQEFFPALLSMLFDPERKGPAEFSTRGVIVSLLFAHLSAGINFDSQKMRERAETILKFLKDPAPEDDKQPLDFVSQMHTPRPYRVWCKEVVNVTKEVFWIFLHHLNVVPIIEVDESVGYTRAHFPTPRPPHPAAPYVGGVEWEATQYLATHLDLLNGLIASLPTATERNALREDMRTSGFEKAMGGTLRTCKEKFYGGVHEGLKCWVSAAKADGWPVEDVRSGPPREAPSPRKSPVKRKADEPPKLALDVVIGGHGETPGLEDAWV